jgi:L-serine/L-threonine ammonia-lyase
MGLHQTTPLIDSTVLSAAAGVPVQLKMECWQEAGSFKIRGIGALCEHYAHEGRTRIVCSSGGNAGYAAAFAARRLGLGATIVVAQSTAPEAVKRMRAQGAQVIVHGAAWDEAHAHALRLCEREFAEARAGYVHPFDDARVWRGNATLVHEIAHERADRGAPDAMVVAVGGGGLLCGVMQGLRDVGWTQTRLVAVETRGAASLAAALAAGRLVALPAIDSIATTLGARTVAAQALREAQSANVVSVVVSDRAAVNACLRFADDHRALVEPACGAARWRMARTRRLRFSRAKRRNFAFRRSAMWWLSCAVALASRLRNYATGIVYYQ